jgi:hypothetical protein
MISIQCWTDCPSVFNTIHAFRIQGTVQRENLKQALAKYSMKLATDAVESGVPLSTEHNEFLDSFLIRARLVSLESTKLCFCKNSKRMIIMATVAGW